MTSSGLKRPLEFDLANPLAGGPSTGAMSQCGVGSLAANVNKRRCINFGGSTGRSESSHSGHNSGSSPFKDPAAVLAPLSEDVASVIRDELKRARDNYASSETPMLTIRQTQLICEKLIRDREQRLREEYDKILINKLAEQYDTFVKYTHDHIEERYKESNSHQASYLS